MSHDADDDRSIFEELADELLVAIDEELAKGERPLVEVLHAMGVEDLVEVEQIGGGMVRTTVDAAALVRRVMGGET